jgi:hypothetical protein
MERINLPKTRFVYNRRENLTNTLFQTPSHPLLHRELLYSSQAPSVSLSHSLPPNAFEPFHAMSQTIKSRLRDLMRQQEEEMGGGDGMEVDGDDEKVEAMMKGMFCEVDGG